eukprot:64660_1
MYCSNFKHFFTSKSNKPMQTFKCFIQLFVYHLFVIQFITHVHVSAQTVSDLVQDFSTQLESIMCDGIRVGGNKCNNQKYGIQDFINSFATNFEQSTQTIDASVTTQIIIDRLNNVLNSRASFLTNISAVIQSECTDFDPSTVNFEDLYFAGNIDKTANLPTDMQFSDVYGADISLGYSTFLIPNGISSTNSKIQNDAKISLSLDTIMKNLYNNYCIDSEDVHTFCSMFFGTINGVYRQFPGIENVKDGANYIDYDPRFTPWYVSAVSRSKDVIILLDTSDAMKTNNRTTLAKSAVTSVLNTLSTDSFVNVIGFNDAGLTKSCFGDNMVAATTRNTAELIDFVESITFPSGGADFTAAFNAAFDILSTSTSCQKAILLLTHGDAPDVTNLVKTRNTAIDANIFSFTLGADSSPNVPKSVAEATNGIYRHIDDDDENLITAMSSYYLFYSHGGLNDIIFTSPHQSILNDVIVISMAMPVYINNTYFAGVVGTDIPLSVLTDAIGDITIGHKSYTFVMNKESELLIHPLITSSSQLFDTITSQYKPIYVTDVEPTEFESVVLPKMLQRENGYISTAASVQLPAGNVIYNGYKQELADLLYIYSGVGPSSLSIAVVVYTELTIMPPNVPAFGMTSAPHTECSVSVIDEQCIAPFNMFHRM